MSIVLLDSEVQASGLVNTPTCWEGGALHHPTQRLQTSLMFFFIRLFIYFLYNCKYSAFLVL